MRRHNKPSASFEADRARLQAEAARSRNAPRFRAHPSSETPALHSLLTAIRGEIEEALPHQINHAGATYTLELMACVHVKVRDADRRDEFLFEGAVIAGTKETS